MASGRGERRGFKSIKGLTKMFKSDIPLKDSGRSGDATTYAAGPATVKQWKDRAKQDAPVTNKQLFSPPTTTTLEYVIRKPDGQRQAPSPTPPRAASPPAPAHAAALQNGHLPYNASPATKPKQSKKQGKKTFRNYVFINEYDSTANGAVPNTRIAPTPNIDNQYYPSQIPEPQVQRFTPPVIRSSRAAPVTNLFNIKKVKVRHIRNGAVGVKDKFSGW